MKKTLLTLTLVAFAGFGTSAMAASGSLEAPKAPEGGWQHAGVTGTFDRGAAQRGLQVYREVCASCHSLNRVAFRTLSGIGFSEAQIKAIAAEYMFPADPDEEGEVGERPGLPSDKFPDVYANKEAAAAMNGGAVPPDLSLITKARMNGDDYLYSLLTHYRDPTAEEEAANPVPDTSYFNPIFPGAAIAMAPPLSEGMVEYAEGQPEATVEQMAHDVTVFLHWAAEPKLEERKKLGFQVMIYLIIFCGIMFFAYRRIAKRVLGH